MTSLVPRPAADDTQRVVRRVTSLQLVGRAEDLSAIRAATKAAADGDGRIVLVSGDAGIGKTRLIEAACAQAREDKLSAVVGGCVQLGELSLAYAPLVEVLRRLREELGEEAMAEMASPALTALIGGEAAGAGELFAPLLDFLIRLGRRRPLLIVFEDLQWADPSTLDLLAFLGRNLRRTKVTLVLTYRSDELHRRHPLRPLLAGLERIRDTERIALTGLSRGEVIELLIGLGRDDVDLSTVSTLLERTAGNPLYLEELVAAAPAVIAFRTALPATVTEAILTRVSQLSATAQAVLRRAAVLGSEIDDRLLAAICDVPPEQITEALREAIGTQLLVLDSGGCRFRHALLAETLYEDLLPGERQRAHVAAARALEAGVHASGLTAHIRWALLAHHWDAAQDLPRAFAASLRAGTEEIQVNAHSAAARHLERALELWDQVPDAAATAGVDRAELLLRAAEAMHFSSRSHRQLTLVNAAYESLGDAAEPERRAAVLERVAHMHWDLHRAAEATAAYERAVQVLADRPPSPERAFALAAFGQSLMLRERYGDAEAALLDAVAGAESIGARRAEAHARCSLGLVQTELGRVDDGLAGLRRALPLSLAHGTRSDVARCHANLAAALLRAGVYDEVVRATADGLAYCMHAGQLDQYGEAITALSVVALTNAGRWQEAVRVDAELTRRLADAGETSYTDYLASRRLLRQLWVGEYDAASPEIKRLLLTTADTDTPSLRGVVLFRAGELARGQRRWDDARSALEDGLRVCETGDGQFDIAYGLAMALSVEADRVEAAYGSGTLVDAEVAHARTVADRLNARVAVLRARVGHSLIGLLPEPAGWLAVADAEHSRARRADTVDQWDAVAAGWDALGMPYPAAIARWRAAAAALRAGRGRSIAGEYATQALQVAQSLGARWLAAEIKLLARRGRLDLDRDSAIQPEPPREALATLGITRREAEVLELLAAGCTNRQIAKSLYISEKTVSVHVTNLLRKLGVTNRIDAAAIAQRLGL